MKKIIIIVLLILLVIILSAFFYWFQFSQNTFTKLKGSRYFNMEFQYPENYRKGDSRYHLGIFGLESPDFKSQKTSFGRQIESGAEITVRIANSKIPLDQEPSPQEELSPQELSLAQEEWINRKLNGTFSYEKATRGVIDGVPVVIEEAWPDPSEGSYVYVKDVNFLNKIREEVAIELYAMSKTKEGLEVYKSDFDKMVSTIKFNP